MFEAEFKIYNIRNTEVGFTPSAKYVATNTLLFLYNSADEFLDCSLLLLPLLLLVPLLLPVFFNFLNRIPILKAIFFFMDLF